MNNMDRLFGPIDPNEVLPFIAVNARLRFGEWEVNASSVRLRCFKEKGIACVACGLTGVAFFVEKSSGSQDNPHLNLYAEVEGVLVLMTRDHVIARADGGSEALKNMQVMCSPCNVRKGSTKGRTASAWRAKLKNTNSWDAALHVLFTNDELIMLEDALEHAMRRPGSAAATMAAWEKIRTARMRTAERRIELSKK